MENNLKIVVEYRDMFLPYQRRISLCLVLISLFLSFNTKNSLAVPAVPNESVIEGTVEEYSIVSSELLNIVPEQTLYRITILIESYENFETKADFLSDKKGKTVLFYSKEKISPDIFDKRVRVKVRFSGDELGGLFWIKEINLIPDK